MNKNVESHFSEVPYIDKPRSIFDRSFEHITSFNIGQVIPVGIDLILPGDTVKMSTSVVARLQTLLTPIFGNMYLELDHFFVPWRLIFDKTKEFFGENTTGPWVQQTQYRLPSIFSPSGGFKTGSLADYFGLPVYEEWSASDRNAPTSLPLRAYAEVINEFWRDQNVSYPLNIPKSDANQSGSNGSDYINDIANGGEPFIACKFHDEFTSCLPSPLKAAQPVSLPGFSDVAVFAGEDHWNLSNGRMRFAFGLDDYQEHWSGDYVSRGGSFLSSTYQVGTEGGVSYSHPWTNAELNYSENSISDTDFPLVPLNLWANTSSIPAPTVNELRLAFQTQRYYEQLARGGSRYIEYMRNFYGVTSPDARLQRPEFLGGQRIPISISQVLNTAQTQDDFLGDVGAMSVTSDVSQGFEKSFTEFGYWLCLAVVRYDHLYSQGLERFWTRRDLFDQYIPTFAHIGEQPKYTYELYATGKMNSADVFGYQEAYSDFRYKPSRISGELRPGIQNSLASWHLGDYYTQAPILSDSWMREDKTNVDRVLAVTSQVSNQILCDFYFKAIYTRVMPMFSVPGLIDHF